MDCWYWTTSADACLSSGKRLAMLTPTWMIPVCLDGDLVPVKGVPALLMVDSRLIPSPHPQDAVADVTTALAG